MRKDEIVGILDRREEMVIEKRAKQKQFEEIEKKFNELK